MGCIVSSFKELFILKLCKLLSALTSNYTAYHNMSSYTKYINIITI
jgi:hypothetical protein